MQFNDTSTKTGLIQDCEFLVFNEYGKITGNTNLLYTFTNLLNRAYDKAVSILVEVDGRWQYDDTSYTTTLIQYTNLTDGQSNYTLDASHLKLTKIRFKDSAGNWTVGKAIDENDPLGHFYLSNQTPNAEGTPFFYDKKGDQLILYPTPDTTVSSGLEITVQRQPNYFTYDDVSQTPGIVPIFHRFLSLDASLQYAVANRLDNKNDFSVMLQDEVTRIKTFYSKRNRDEQKMLRAKFINAR